MWRKILGWVVLTILLGGSICGIVYGVKYSNLKNTDTLTPGQVLKLPPEAKLQ